MDPQLERREDRMTLELHRLVVDKLAIDPGAVLAVVPENLAVLRAGVRGPVAHEWLDDWERLTSTGPLDELIAVMLGTDQRSISMRQVGPFNGVLTQEERIEAIRKAAKPS
ncbi:hypothetical protein ACX3O0_01300 [Homoserinimonas sp. A447]